MTLRDYYNAKKQIRKNKKSNLKNGNKVDASTCAYAVNKQIDKENKAHEKMCKKQNKKPVFKFLKKNKAEKDA